MKVDPEDRALADALGARYAERCVCGHVLVTSDRKITTPQVLPCCVDHVCVFCDGTHEQGALWDMSEAEGDHNHDPGSPPGKPFGVPE
jgi:hypothetical protein